MPVASAGSRSADPLVDGRMALVVLAPFLAMPLVDHAVARLAVGPLTRHMLAHIVLMNAVAVLAGLAITRLWRNSVSWRVLAAATTVQLALLWAWHAPPLLRLALDNHIYHLASSASLSSAAVWFWTAVLSVRGSGRWLSIAALLVTAKLFCLLGALLVFAPRDLVGANGPLDDQQLAGLAMIIACPLTYVTAGVVLSARWLAELSRAGGTNGHAPELQCRGSG